MHVSNEIVRDALQDEGSAGTARSVPLLTTPVHFPMRYLGVAKDACFPSFLSQGMFRGIQLEATLKKTFLHGDWRQASAGPNAWV
jgi:hypothetical protein